jgi:hypothetical protein
MALVRIPLPATILTVRRCRSNQFIPGVHDNKAYLAFFVSSAMCPDASKPVSVPAVNKLMRCSISLNPTPYENDVTHIDKIQFHPAGAPVPLSKCLVMNINDR